VSARRHRLAGGGPLAVAGSGKGPRTLPSLLMCDAFPPRRPQNLVCRQRTSVAPVNPPHTNPSPPPKPPSAPNSPTPSNPHHPPTKSHNKQLPTTTSTKHTPPPTAKTPKKTHKKETQNKKAQTRAETNRRRSDFPGIARTAHCADRALFGLRAVTAPQNVWPRARQAAGHRKRGQERMRLEPSDRLSRFERRMFVAPGEQRKPHRRRRPPPSMLCLRISTTSTKPRRLNQERPRPETPPPTPTRPPGVPGEPWGPRALVWSRFEPARADRTVARNCFPPI